MHDQKPAAGDELRRLAEKQVGPQTYDSKALNASEAFRALHELRVHQAELEMQNEELRSTQVELTESRARYVELFDFAPVGYVTLDEQGCILEVNLTATTMLRVSRTSLLGRYLSAFVAQEHGDAFHLFRQRRLADHDTAVISADFRIERPTAPEFWVHLDTTIAEDAIGAPLMRVTMTDISQRVLADEVIRRDALAIATAAKRLEAQAAQLRRAEALAHMGSWRLDLDTGERAWSPEMYVIFGVDPGVSDAELDQAVRGTVVDQGERLRDIDLGLGPDGVPHGMDYRIVTPSGESRWVHIDGEPELDSSGRVYAVSGFVQDITGRKQGEVTAT